MAAAERNWLHRARQIAGDRESGATAIAVDCCQLVLSYLDAEAPASVSGLRAVLEEMATIVLHGQPTMALVIRVVSTVLSAADIGKSFDEADNYVRIACREWLEMLEADKERIATNALQLLPRQGRLVTISHSSDVWRLLLRAAGEGYAIHVTALESRPTMEGRSLATALAQHGIPTRVVVDAAAYIAVKGADLWLAGADSLTSEGVVNKVGTAILGLSAGFHHVPGVIVCNSVKIWPAVLGCPPILLQEAGEVWENPPEGVAVENPYFDLTPWECVETVVTERGIHQPEEIVSYSNAINIHPRVMSIMEEIPSAG